LLVALVFRGGTKIAHIIAVGGAGDCPEC